MRVGLPVVLYWVLAEQTSINDVAESSTLRFSATTRTAEVKRHE